MALHLQSVKYKTGYLQQRCHFSIRRYIIEAMAIQLLRESLRAMLY